MMIGALGNIPFETSSDKTLLLSGLKWDSGMRYAEHMRHNETGMLEYVGKNPDEISFSIKLSAFLGINPTNMMERLRSLHNSRKAVKFALGTMPIAGMWVLTDMKCEMEHFHKDGTLLSVDASITLREYVESVNLPVITKRISFTDRMVAGPYYTPPPASPPASPQPSPTPSRTPVVPATTKPVTLNNTPVTKPTITPADVAKTVATVKKAAHNAQVLATDAVNHVAAQLGKLDIVKTIKQAFSTPSYTTTKATPAKPVVTKPAAPKSSGGNKNVQMTVN